MTVQELITELQKAPQSATVVLARDSEGNTYSPLCTVDYLAIAYQPSTTYRGEVKLTELTPELEEEGYGEGDVADPETSERCVCLWPIW